MSPSWFLVTPASSSVNTLAPLASTRVRWRAQLVGGRERRVARASGLREQTTLAYPSLMLAISRSRCSEDLTPGCLEDETSL